jgi:hypothetical protein
MPTAIYCFAVVYTYRASCFNPLRPNDADSCRDTKPSGFVLTAQRHTN